MVASEVSRRIGDCQGSGSYTTVRSGIAQINKAGTLVYLPLVTRSITRRNAEAGIGTRIDCCITWLFGNGGGGKG
ncbi:hypothetical protein AHMF7605_20590 [Adhaeribacter arboris]|uniref:Uncharacterized protein n=1 Tax=Adhaeribacter arboris TaxID=2072846 RepID=A0A2T2YJP9_9BACT|nr:hypothetical protein AHMF7605_20590 [Adhaeribacter arboris]